MGAGQTFDDGSQGPDSTRLTKSELDKNPLVINYMMVTDNLIQFSRRSNALEIARDCVSGEEVDALQRRLDAWIDDILYENPHEEATKHKLLNDTAFRQEQNTRAAEIFPMINKVRREVHNKYHITFEQLKQESYLPKDKLIEKLRIVNAMEYLDELTTNIENLQRKLEGTYIDGVIMAVNGKKVYNGQKPYVTSPITSHFAVLHGILQPAGVRATEDMLLAHAGKNRSAVKELVDTLNESFKVVESFLSSRKDAVTLTLIKPALARQCESVNKAIDALEPMREHPSEDLAVTFVELDVLRYNFNELIQHLRKSLEPGRS